MSSKLANLLSIKSLVTLSLTLVFAINFMLNRQMNQDFMTIYLMVITFYFAKESKE